MSKITKVISNKKNKVLTAALISAMLIMTGCSSNDAANIISQTLDSTVSATTTAGSETAAAENETGEVASTTESSASEYLSGSVTSASTSTLIDTTDVFTERDLTQSPDLGSATTITLTSNQDVNITQEGTYVITGSAEQCSIIVDADAAKVQLVLDGVTITNTNFPAIYVKNADKVFVTTTDSTSTLTVSGTFTADGTTNTDAVIFSKDDLVLNGVGTLNINSTANGITSKDDLKVTGGTYNITSKEDAIEANDSICVYDGSFTINSEKDGLHSENSDDTTVGYIYIEGGNFKIDAAEDGVQATTVLMINGGTFDITAQEGLEATYVQINGGTINISASDDGINATQKSTSYDVVIMINDGNISITMGSGDTDALDANGDLIINGGTIDITAQFAFDYDKNAELNGGTVTVNGEQVTSITNSMMMGGMGGGRGDFKDQNGEAPSGEMPEGFENGQMPGGQRPEGFNKDQMQKGERPEGFERGQFQQGQSTEN